jgi:TetR/AcrR family transcriptional repressor of mexJK operon
MRTLIAAEAHRFPDVAADYVTRSWTRNIRMLAEALGVLTARGLLRIDDPDLAAEQLTWLVVAAPLNRLTLQAGAHPYRDDELQAIATQGVATFMSRYGPEDMERR